jgi:VCBS repeat-containing protein
MGENETKSFDVIANDTKDADHTAANTISLNGNADITGPDGVTLGTPTITIENNQVKVDPGTAFDALAANEHANITVHYMLTGDAGDTSIADLTIDVVGTNDVPLAVADSGSMGENEIKSFDVIANDAKDADHTAANTISLNGAADITGPDGVTLGAPTITIENDQVKVDPAIAFDALAANEHASITVHYTLTGDAGDTSNADLTIDVVGTNDVPVAVADTGTMGENETKSFDVIANDTKDADHTAANTISLNGAADITGPDGVTLGAPTITIENNQVKVDPGTAFDALAANEQATITVHYTLTGDAGDTSNADLTIAVSGANDVPLAVADSGSMGENEIKSFDVIANDTKDADHTAANTISLNGNAVITGPDGVTLGTPTITIENNQVKVDPGTVFDTLAANEHASITVHYTLTGDAGDTSNANLTIDVVGTNDAASISGTATGDVTEDNPAKASGTLSVADADHDQNAFSAADGGNHAGTQGYGTFAFDAASGHWTYALDSSNSAVNALNNGDTLHDFYTVHSMDGSASQTIDVTIHGVTDPSGPPPAPAVYSGTGDPNDHDEMGNPAGTTVNAGSGGATTTYGGAGDDTINGNNGQDTIYAGSGNDYANGNNAPDQIYGGSGNDTLIGSKGADVLIGGYGADILTGGDAGDTFVFLSTRDTGDTITDFKANGDADTIDLTALGHLSFVAGDSGSAVVANSVTWTEYGGNTFVSVDTTGDTTADLQIKLTGVNLHLTSADFHLA